LIAVALFGAGIAPTLLAWGLQRAGATTGALLLNLEAVFTVLLARIVYRESIGRRVSLALLLMASGGVALGLEAGFSKGFSLWGALAVALATLSWALDNTLTRGLAEQDPVHVVALKGALGASITLSAAVLWREPVPGLRAAIVIALAGATGYGLSLRLYLLAQRRIGAARTGSIFAIAPFVGAALSWAIGDKAPGPLALGAAVLFGLGVWLHATERHEHRHAHPVVDHEHAHRHDDGHHHHHHDPPFLAEHSHPHHHDLLEHDHDHAPDVHHDHSHST
jgi:drug/metabolite transporter (DMT)-like permease